MNTKIEVKDTRSPPLQQHLVEQRDGSLLCDVVFAQQKFLFTSTYMHTYIHIY